jgi:hypothetical protein
VLSQLPVLTLYYVQNHSQIEDNNGDDGDIEAPLFTCRQNCCPIELHTHAFAKHVIYHISWEAFTTKGSHNLHLTEDAAKHWNSLTKPATQKTLAKLPKLKIPGRKMSR